MIAINAALWGTFGTIQSYEGLFILGENIVLAAPLTLSITNLYYEVMRSSSRLWIMSFRCLTCQLHLIGDVYTKSNLHQQSQF